MTFGLQTPERGIQFIQGLESCRIGAEFALHGQIDDVAAYCDVRRDVDLMHHHHGIALIIDPGVAPSVIIRTGPPPRTYLPDGIRFAQEVRAEGLEHQTAGHGQQRDQSIVLLGGARSVGRVVPFDQIV